MKKSKIAERAFSKAREKIAEKNSLEALMAPHGRWDIRFEGNLWTAFPVYETRAMGVGATIREAVECAIERCTPGITSERKA